MGEGSWEENLLNFDLMEMYDEIAAQTLSPPKVIQLCSALQCKVDLRRGNIIYSVEKKYKEKLEKYNQTNRINWLNKNLKRIVPNPYEKFLKWQHKHNKHKTRNWLQRKLIALDYFINLPPILYFEEPCTSVTTRQSVRRQSQYSQGERRLSRLASNETSNCSTLDNMSSESVQTVIASQPKQTQDSSFNPLLNFDAISESNSSSYASYKPPLVRHQDFPVENEAQSTQRDVRMSMAVIPQTPKKRILSLLQESADILSEEMEYSHFHQDKLVTSTQTFGDDD